MVDSNERTFREHPLDRGHRRVELASGSSESQKLVIYWTRRKVYTLLKSNTRDEIGQSHVDTVTVAKGTRLSEERVRRAYVDDPYPSLRE